MHSQTMRDVASRHALSNREQARQRVKDIALFDDMCANRPLIPVPHRFSSRTRTPGEVEAKRLANKQPALFGWGDWSAVDVG